MKISLKEIKVPPEIRILIFVLLLLLFWYALSFTLHLIRPPSDAMSREMEVTNLDYGFSKIMNHHVITIPLEDRGLVTVLAVDGRELQIIDLDITGRTRQWKTIDLDLSQASDIDAAYTDYNTIRLLYLTRSLYLAEIHLEDGRFSVKKIDDEVRGFDMAGLYAVINKGEAIKIFNTDDEAETLIPASGEIESFCADLETGTVEILSVQKKDWESVSVALSEFNTTTGNQNQYQLHKSVPSKFFKDLVDIKISDGVLTSLFKYRDRRFGVNRMTVQAIDLDQKRTIKEGRYAVPLFNSSFTLIDSPPGTTSFIHQMESVSGVNLAIATVDDEGVLEETLITKTKSMSKLAGFFTLKGNHGILFSDINFDKRALLFASNHPQVMKSQSRLSTLPLWYPAGTTVLIFLVSIIAGGLFLLGEIPIPAAAAFLLDRFPQGEHKPLYLIKSGIIAVIHTAVKVLLTRVLLESGGNFRFRPLFFGSESAFYISLVSSSVLCCFLALKSNKQQEMNPNRCMSFYYRLSIMDFLLYVPMVIMYLISSILLSKI